METWLSAMALTVLLVSSANTKSMTLFQALALKVKKIDPGKLPLEAVEEFAATQASAVQRITQVRQTAAAVLDEVSVEGAESINVEKMSLLPFILAAAGVVLVIVIGAIIYYFYKKKSKGKKRHKQKSKKSTKKHKKKSKGAKKLKKEMTKKDKKKEEEVPKPDDEKTEDNIKDVKADED